MTRRSLRPIRVGSLLLPHRIVRHVQQHERLEPTGQFGYAVSRLNELCLAYLHLVDPVTIGGGAGGRLAPELGGVDRETATIALARNETDWVAFGVPFLANPDLPARLRRAAPLNAPVRATFYGGDEHAYTDYPALQDLSVLTDIPAAVSH